MNLEQLIKEGFHPEQRILCIGVVIGKLLGEDKYNTYSMKEITGKSIDNVMTVAKAAAKDTSLYMGGGFEYIAGASLKINTQTRIILTGEEFINESIEEVTLKFAGLEPWLEKRLKFAGFCLNF